MWLAAEPSLQDVVELTIGLTKIGSVTYAFSKSGITFRRTLMYMTRVNVSTDKLLVSEEAVRVLDRRE